MTTTQIDTLEAILSDMKDFHDMPPGCTNPCPGYQHCFGARAIAGLSILIGEIKMAEHIKEHQRPEIAVDGKTAESLPTEPDTSANVRTWETPCPRSVMEPPRMVNPPNDPAITAQEEDR